MNKRIFGTTARRGGRHPRHRAHPARLAVLMARAILRRVSATAFQPEFGAHLDQALGVYADLARAIKQEMRAEADAIAASEPLPRRRRRARRGALDAELARAFAAHPSLVELRVGPAPARARSPTRARDRPVDPATERTWPCSRPLGAGAPADGELPRDRPTSPSRSRRPSPRRAPASTSWRACRPSPRPTISSSGPPRAVPGPDLRQRLRRAARRHAGAGRGRGGAGDAPGRPRRIARLADGNASRGRGRSLGAGGARGRRRGRRPGPRLRPHAGGAGDEPGPRGVPPPHGRVAEDGAPARARDQEPAHPHPARRRGVPPALPAATTRSSSSVLQTTFEVVEEEVGSLRRLVSEFSEFARLPRAALKPGDLGGSCASRRRALRAAEGDARRAGAVRRRRVSVRRCPQAPMPAVLDAEMLHRVLTNVIRNAAQAIRDARPRRSAARCTLDRCGRGRRVPDHARRRRPGIPEEVAGALFDPYVTTKRDGTGLGLSHREEDRGGPRRVHRGRRGAARRGPNPHGAAEPRERRGDGRAGAVRGAGQRWQASRGVAPERWSMVTGGLARGQPRGASPLGAPSSGPRGALGRLDRALADAQAGEDGLGAGVHAEGLATGSLIGARLGLEQEAGEDLEGASQLDVVAALLEDRHGAGEVLAEAWCGRCPSRRRR